MPTRKSPPALRHRPQVSRDSSAVSGAEKWGSGESDVNGDPLVANPAPINLFESKKMKKHRRTGMEVTLEIAALQHIFEDAARHGERGISKNDFWKEFGPHMSLTGERVPLRVREHSSAKTLQDHRSHFTVEESRQMCNDMYHSLDKKHKGFVTIEDMLRGFYKYMDPERLKKLASKVKDFQGSLAAVKTEVAPVQKLSEDRLNEIQETFAMLDPEGTGRLYLDQFRAVIEDYQYLKLDSAGVEEEFNKIDIDRKGYLTSTDLINWIQNTAFVAFDDLNKGLSHNYSDLQRQPSLGLRQGSSVFSRVASTLSRRRSSAGNINDKAAVEAIIDQVLNQARAVQDGAEEEVDDELEETAEAHLASLSGRGGRPGGGGQLLHRDPWRPGAGGWRVVGVERRGSPRARPQTTEGACEGRGGQSTAQLRRGVGEERSWVSRPSTVPASASRQSSVLLHSELSRGPLPSLRRLSTSKHAEGTRGSPAGEGGAGRAVLGLPAPRKEWLVGPRIDWASLGIVRSPILSKQAPRAKRAPPAPFK